MWTDRFEGLRQHLRERFGEDFRWLAVFDSDDYDYDVRYVRDDLETQLTEHQLDYVVHRSMAVFNRRQAENVYFHLGAADYLVAGYGSGTAYHVYLEDDRGVVVVLDPDVDVELPGFIEEIRSEIDSE